MSMKKFDRWIKSSLSQIKLVILVANLFRHLLFHCTKFYFQAPFVPSTPLPILKWGRTQLLLRPDSFGHATVTMWRWYTASEVYYYHLCYPRLPCNFLRHSVYTRLYKINIHMNNLRRRLRWFFTTCSSGRRVDVHVWLLGYAIK